MVAYARDGPVIYAIMVACSASLLYCVPAPGTDRRFETTDKCEAYVALNIERWSGRMPDYPVVMGRCRPWIRGAR